MSRGHRALFDGPAKCCPRSPSQELSRTRHRGRRSSSVLLWALARGAGGSRSCTDRASWGARLGLESHAWQREHTFDSTTPLGQSATSVDQPSPRPALANFMCVQFKHDLPAFHDESIEMSPLALLALPRHRVRGVRPAWLAVLPTQRDLDVQVRQVRHSRWLIRSVAEKISPPSTYSIARPLTLAMYETQ